MEKPVIDTIKKLNSIPLLKRKDYYISRDIIRKVKSFSASNERLVAISSTAYRKIIVKPIWEDALIKVEDKELQTVANMEILDTRRYVSTHTQFCMQVRETVLEKLVEASQLLPPHISLVIKAGYRPISVQEALFRKLFSYYKQKLAGATYNEIYKNTSYFISDPSLHYIAHATGGAVDVILFDAAKQRDIDMGSPINYPIEASWTNYDRLTKNKRMREHFLLIQCSE